MADKTVIEAGDSLILRASDFVTAEQAAEIKRRVRDVLPQIADVLVLGMVEEIAVVKAPVREEEDRDA